MTVAVEWGTGQVLLSLLWLAAFVIWAWLAIALVTGGVVYLLSPILAPFLAGAILAYVFNPLVGRLTGRYLPRSAAVVIVLLRHRFVGTSPFFAPGRRGGRGPERTTVGPGDRGGDGPRARGRGRGDDRALRLPPGHRGHDRVRRGLRAGGPAALDRPVAGARAGPLRARESGLTAGIPSSHQQHWQHADPQRPTPGPQGGNP